MVLSCKNIYISQDESSSVSENEDSIEHKSEDAYSCDRDLLVVRKILDNQPSPHLESQRENIFHIRYKVSENTCSLVVDSKL